MASYSDLVESVKQTALALDRSVVRLAADPNNEDKMAQVGDLIDSIRGDLDKLDTWIDAGCPLPAPEEK